MEHGIFSVDYALHLVDYYYSTEVLLKLMVFYFSCQLDVKVFELIVVKVEEIRYKPSEV